MTGHDVDATAVMGTGAAETSGVPEAAALLEFTEALVADDDTALREARDRLRSALGDAAFVDAAAVASNFERMVRIADGTGIPLDAPIATLGFDLRRGLGLDRFASAANTPLPGWLARVAGALLRPLARAWLRMTGRLRRMRARRRR